MADTPKASKSSLIPLDVTFEKVTTPFDRATHSRREDSFFTVHPSGLSISNVAGCEDLDWLAEQAGEDRKDYLVELGCSKEKKLVEIKVTKAEEPGVQRVARSSDGKTLSISLGGVFRQYRSVAVKQKRQCAVVLDRENLRMILSLGTPRSTRKTATRSADAEGAQAAAKATRSGRAKKQASPAPAEQGADEA